MVRGHIRADALHYWRSPDSRAVEHQHIGVLPQTRAQMMSRFPVGMRRAAPHQLAGPSAPESRRRPKGTHAYPHPPRPRHHQPAQPRPATPPPRGRPAHCSAAPTAAPPTSSLTETDDSATCPVCGLRAHGPRGEQPRSPHSAHTDRRPSHDPSPRRASMTAAPGRRPQRATPSRDRRRERSLEADLTRWGRVVRIETPGDASGRPRQATVGFVEAARGHAARGREFGSHTLGAQPARRAALPRRAREVRREHHATRLDERRPPRSRGCAHPQVRHAGGAPRRWPGLPAHAQAAEPAATRGRADGATTTLANASTRVLVDHRHGTSGSVPRAHDAPTTRVSPGPGPAGWAARRSKGPVCHSTSWA